MSRNASRAVAGALLLCGWGMTRFVAGAAAADDPPANPPAVRPAIEAPRPPPPPAPAPPNPPPPRNPVQVFREILALTPEAREQALRGKTEWQQRYLHDRFREFDALPAPEREVRLRLMQVRYYLLPLLRSAPTNRALWWAAVPAEDRPMIQQRLQDWDRLPPPQQEEFLTNEPTLSLLPGFEASSPARREAMLQAFSAERRHAFEADLQRWRDLPEDQRLRITKHFNQFFELTGRQQQKALRDLTEPDRVRMQQAIAGLEKLSPDERARCLAALDRFARMTPAEKARFVQNAVRWQSMSLEERQALQSSLARLQPSGVPLRPPPVPPPDVPSRRSLNPTNTQAAK